jgi:hypothetical protein
MESAVDKNYQDRLQTLKFTTCHSRFSIQRRFSDASHTVRIVKIKCLIKHIR